MDIQARLKALSDDLADLVVEARILDEQIDFQADVADDARLRSIVSETPLADRDAREAGGDLERMRRVRADLASKIDAVRAEQDRLLERMLER